MLNPMSESVVERASPQRNGRCRVGDDNLDARSSQLGNPTPAHLRIRIDGRNHATADARANQRVSTRPGASMMRARLQRDICSRPLCRVANRCSLLQRDNLGVIKSSIVMRAFAQDGLAANQHTADRRVGRSKTHRFAGEIQCSR